MWPQVTTGDEATHTVGSREDRRAPEHYAWLEQQQGLDQRATRNESRRAIKTTRLLRLRRPAQAAAAAAAAVAAPGVGRGRHAGLATRADSALVGREGNSYGKECKQGFVIAERPGLSATPSALSPSAAAARRRLRPLWQKRPLRHVAPAVAWRQNENQCG